MSYTRGTVLIDLLTARTHTSQQLHKSHISATIIIIIPLDKSEHICAHLCFPGMPSETALAIASILLGGVLERHSKLRFCFAHGAGSFPYIAGRFEHGYNVRPDLCAVACKHAPSHYRGRFYADSLVHDGGALELLTNFVGKVSTMHMKQLMTSVSSIVSYSVLTIHFRSVNYNREKWSKNRKC